MNILAEFPRRSLSRMCYNIVRILHPGCSHLIFALPAFPYPATHGTEHDSLVYGVDHRLVMDGCHIVTNFRAADKGDSYLSTDRAGHDRVLSHNDGVLPPGSYFYHPAPPSVSKSNYRVVTDFVAWKFPKSIPDHWQRRKPSHEEYVRLYRKYVKGYPPDLEYAISEEDDGCVVTKYQYLEVSPCHAHYLVPRLHESWFYRNSMTQFNWTRAEHEWDRGIHDPANGIILRADVGDCFEKHGWVFYPTGEDQLMTYVCLPYIDYAELLHRRLVTLSHRVANEFLYARFAHTMITLVDKTSEFRTFRIPVGARPSKREPVMSTEQLFGEYEYDDD